VRVDTERLDQLMNLAGQLAINKARFAQIGGALKGQLGTSGAVRRLNSMLGFLDRLADRPEAEADPQRLRAEFATLRSQAVRIRNDLGALRAECDAMTEVRGSVGDLLEAVHQLDRVSAEIQQSVMATRMVPIGPLFGRFKRVVRDIARASGKDIRLVIRGEKTELDKRLIDELGDPLTHAIRNAADHGIEPPEARAAAGKPAEGTVTLDAFHRGNSIVIQVSDDGKGLDTGRILQKCLQRGLLTEADAARMAPRQIWQMVWEPGFSTAEQVTEVSGRGMGMDIVRSKIAGINGALELDSSPGQGTTLTIKLPLTLAILPSLMVEIGGDCFAVPMESVKEIVGLAAGDVTTIQGRAAVQVRNRTMALERLDELVAFRDRDARAEAESGARMTLVVVGEPGRETALAVDRVIGEEDVVIKSIAENFRNVPGIAGATILGDGRVALIFDVPALIDLLSRRGRDKGAGPFGRNGPDGAPPRTVTSSSPAFVPTA
jgi:two-component system chemotaxis sensor kinase CheA